MPDTNYTAEQQHLMRAFARGDLAGDLDWLLSIAVGHATGERLEDMRSRFTDAIETATNRDMGKLGSIKGNHERSALGNARCQEIAKLWPDLLKSHSPAEAKKKLAARFNVNVRTIRRYLTILKIS